jgi:hypothetical protein
MLRVFPAELDAAQFEQLVFEGRDALAAGAAAKAVQLLDQAMALWRGPPLTDFVYEPFAQAEIARLEELRLACLEERFDANLALGSTSALTAELGRMVTHHPLRERLRGQLMLALYRSGRQAEALETYHLFRSTLREELGLEPSSMLDELQAAILRHDPLLILGPAPSGSIPTRRPVTVLCVWLQVAPGPGAALDPEAHGAVHEQVVAALTAVLERQGGKLAASDGEHLMGVSRPARNAARCSGPAHRPRSPRHRRPPGHCAAAPGRGRSPGPGPVAPPVAPFSHERQCGEPGIHRPP